MDPSHVFGWVSTKQNNFGMEGVLWNYHHVVYDDIMHSTWPAEVPRFLTWTDHEGCSVGESSEWKSQSLKRQGAHNFHEVLNNIMRGGNVQLRIGKMGV